MYPNFIVRGYLVVDKGQFVDLNQELILPTIKNRYLTLLNQNDL